MWKICTTKQNSATKARGWTLLPIKCLSLQPRYFAKEEMAQIWKVGVRANSNRVAIRKTEATGLSHHLLPHPGDIKAPFSSSRSWCSMCPQSSTKQATIEWHPPTPAHRLLVLRAMGGGRFPFLLSHCPQPAA